MQRRHISAGLTSRLTMQPAAKHDSNSPVRGLPFCKIQLRALGHYSPILMTKQEGECKNEMDTTGYVGLYWCYSGFYRYNANMKWILLLSGHQRLRGRGPLAGGRFLADL